MQKTCWGAVKPYYVIQNSARENKIIQLANLQRAAKWRRMEQLARLWTRDNKQRTQEQESKTEGKVIQNNAKNKQENTVGKTDHNTRL